MKNAQRGFSLVELLVVISIIGVLSSIIAVSVNTARSKGRISKARADMSNIRTAIEILKIDTGRVPGALGESPCIPSPDPSNNELHADADAAGLLATDGNFPGWGGPYLKINPLDPWGNPYIFDIDYECTASPLQDGCENFSGLTVRAVHSAGPSGTGIAADVGAPGGGDFNQYGSDEIVLVLCQN